MKKNKQETRNLPSKLPIENRKWSCKCNEKWKSLWNRYMSTMLNWWHRLCFLSLPLLLCWQMAGVCSEGCDKCLCNVGCDTAVCSTACDTGLCSVTGCDTGVCSTVCDTGLCSVTACFECWRFSSSFSRKSLSVLNFNKNMTSFFSDSDTNRYVYFIYLYVFICISFYNLLNSISISYVHDFQHINNFFFEYFFFLQQKIMIELENQRCTAERPETEYVLWILSSIKHYNTIIAK